MLVLFGGVDFIFRQVRDVDGLLQSQQVGGGDEGHIFVAAVKGPGQLAFVQVRKQLREYLSLPGKLLVSALHGLLALVDAALHHFDVRHDQLQVDDVNVPDGVRGALHVGDIGILKAPDHMDNGIRGPNVAQELVAQAFTLGGTLYKAGDVHELNDSGSGLLGLVQVGQPLEPLIRYGHHAYIGINGAERVVVRGDSRVGDGIEQGRFTHIGKTDDT